MKYSLNIDHKFYVLISKNLKHHEFRLNKPERSAIKIGDILILKDHSNPCSALYVEVLEISHYISWESILEDFYESDFSNLNMTKEKVLKELKSFYKEDDVSKYGLIVFTIKTIKEFSV